MMDLRSKQGNFRLNFRLFKSYARIRLNNLEISLRFPCLGLNSIIDSINLIIAAIMSSF